MLLQEIKYLDEAIRYHVGRFFTSEARAAFEATELHWCDLSDAAHPLKPGVFIPTDISCTSVPIDAWKVPFGNTNLTLWNALPPPSNEWRLLDSSAPLWYVHPCGALVPAWNLARTLFDLLTLKEETVQLVRDPHGRFVGKMSPRDAAGLLENPIFNDSVAALVAACVGIQRSGLPDTALEPRLVAPPILVLSHDLDQLRGNDFWTQAVRVIRTFIPVGFELSKLRNIWFAIVNMVMPRRYFFDNVIGMIEIERMLGFTSTLYFLNGTGGRYGARSGSGLIPTIADLTPRGWNLGMHYNYDTHLDPQAFANQIEELSSLIGRTVLTGRAHYLRFDPAHSWQFYNRMGMQADESLGYSDRIGYRAGIAGPFRPFDPVIGRAMPLVEMPMVMMEGALVGQYSVDPAGAFERHLRHIVEVGGALSLLFHPGQFHNPEFPETLGLYRRLLGLAKRYNVRSMNVCDF